jgi:SAM-dependent methyltransferase
LSRRSGDDRGAGDVVSAATAGIPADAAHYYDEYWSAEVEPYYEPDPTLSRLLFDGVDGGTRVLDVGCGPARSYALELARRAGSYTGVDVSAEAIRAATAAGFDARLVTDASDLPFPEGSFDLVVCVEVLEHLFAPDRAVSAIHRVLRPGGKLVASAPNVAYWRLRASLAAGVWNPTGDALSVERPWRDPHLRFFTPSTLERMLRLSGYRDVDVGAHGGRGLDHLTTRPTAHGQSRLYRLAERRLPSVLGMTVHAVAVK